MSGLSQAETPLVSVVVVSWNTREHLSVCLASLLEERTRAAFPMEVIVVDNASSDGSPRMVQSEYPWVRLLRNRENVGFARANNQAIEVSRGRYLLLLNSDTRVLEGAIPELVQFMRLNRDVGAAGAMLLNDDGSLQISCRPMLTPFREFWRLSYLDVLLPLASYKMSNWASDSPRPVEVMMGACMMVRRVALDEIGLFDVRYFMYTEEVDLCHRLSRAGWELWYVPTARIVHFGQASSRQVQEEMFVQLYRSKIQFFRKFGGERTIANFKRMLQIAYVPRLFAARLFSAFSSNYAEQASKYATLLRELASM